MTEKDEVAVIFDVDGVLIDSAAPHFRSWQLLGEENNATITKDHFAETFGRHNRDIIPRLFPSADEGEVLRLADRKEELYRQLVCADPPLVDGAAALVEELHQCGARLAVGSSGPLANIKLILAALGATDVIQTIVSGDDVTSGKPDPQVFTLACEKLDVDPKRCVVIEDAPVGIDAARAAGTKSIGVCLYHPPATLSGADLIVEQLSDLTVEAIQGVLS